MADGTMVKLGQEVEKAVKQYAEKLGCSVTEAANRLMATGIKRLRAIHKYSDAQRSEAKPAKKAAKAKPAKKAAKAKGPIARKAPKAKAEATAAA